MTQSGSATYHTTHEYSKIRGHADVPDHGHNRITIVFSVECVQKGPDARERNLCSTPETPEEWESRRVGERRTNSDSK